MKFPNIMPIIFDGISSFYWENKKPNDVLLQHNLKTILSAIFKVVDKYFVSNKDFAELAKHIEKLGNLREL